MKTFQEFFETEMTHLILSSRRDRDLEQWNRDAFQDLTDHW